MAAIRIYRRLQDLQDVDPNGLPQSGVPRYHTDVSSFVVETIAGGAGGSFSLGASTGGNTLGDTGVTGTRVVLAGVGNLTLSQATDVNGGTITISGGTAAAGGVAISASDSLFSSGTVVLSGVGGGATINTAPGTVQISVAAPVAQSVQTQNRFNLTLDGNTAGVLQEVSSGTLTLAGGNSITLSQNGNAVTIIGPTTSQSLQPETQTFVGGVAASNTTYTSGTVSIVGSGIVSVQSGTGQRVIVNASQSVQPETKTFIGGIAASNTTYTSGTVTISGVGGGVTVNSNTGQRVDISVAAPVAQTGTQFSAGLTNSGNTSGDTGAVAGRLLLVGTNNITLSGSTNGASMTVTLSGPSVAGAQTGISGIANSQTTYTSGTVSLSELGAITIRSTTGNQFQFSVNAQTGTQFSAGISGGNTSGDSGTVAGRVVLAGGNNITLSGSTNGVSETITISAFTQSVESQSLGMSNLGNTSGTTGIASGGQVRYLFAGGNNVTLSQSLNGASGTVTISAFNQTGTQFSAGISGGNTSGDTGTVAGRVVFAGGNNVTLSGSTNGVSETITISAFSQSVESQSIGMSNLGNTAGTTGVASGGQVRFVIVGSNNISLSQSLNGASGTISISGQPSFSAGVSTGGNTQGNTGVSGTRLVLVGSNNITLSQNTDASGATVSISGQSPTGGAFSAGVSNLGNTAGSTGISGSRIVFVGTNQISLSQSTDANGATVSFNDTVSAFQAGVSTGGNTAGDTGVTGTRLVLVAPTPLSLSQATGANGATISINAPATSSIVGSSGISISTTGSTIIILPTPANSHNPFDEVGINLTANQGAGTVHMAPIRFPHVQFDRFVASYQISNASNSSNSFTISQWVGIYTNNASTLSLLVSSSTSTNFSGSGTVGSYSLYGGSRNLTMGWTTTLSAGDYWVGINFRTTTGGGAGHTVNQILRSWQTFASLTSWGGEIGVGSNATRQQVLGLGTYSVSTAGMPNAIGFNELTGSGTVPFFQPLYYVRSGTA